MHDRILNVALDIVEQQGTEAVSMRHIAETLKVTPMALYKYFANREEMLNEVIDSAFMTLGQQWTQQIRNKGIVGDLNDIGMDLVDFALAHPYLYRAMFLEPRTKARRFPNDFTGSNTSPTYTIVLDIVTRGVKSGVLVRLEPAQIALGLGAQVQGLIALYQGGRLASSADEFRHLCRKSIAYQISSYTK